MQLFSFNFPNYSTKIRFFSNISINFALQCETVDSMLMNKSKETVFHIA